MKGISIITHTGKGWYFGGYRSGVFSDNNQWNRAVERTGWGFKFDLFLGRVLRPVPVISQLWDQRPIHEIMASGETTAKGFFGDRVYALLRIKQGLKPPREIRDFKYAGTNPWYGKFWFLLDTKIAVPCLFISVSTPWKSFYYGFKTYQVDPLTKDSTWSKGTEPYRAACPSATMRSDRG